MASWDEIKRWNADAVGQTGDVLIKARNDVLGLQDEIDDSATPAEWHGEAAEKAKKELQGHRQELEVFAAEIAALAKIVDVTEADVQRIQRLVGEAEDYAARYEFRIENGAVVDAGEGSVIRPLTKVILEGTIQTILSDADDVDKDLHAVMDQVMSGKISDQGATTLAAAARAGEKPVELAEILEKYQTRADKMVSILGQTVTKTEADMLNDIGIPGMLAMRGIRSDAMDTAASRFPEGPGDHSHRNAFQHAYWNALMVRKYGAEWTTKFATAHEGVPGNPPDNEAMDLHNNEIGRRIAVQNPNASPEELANLIEKAVRDGQTVVIDRNGELQYSNDVKAGETGNPNDPAPEPRQGEPGSGSTGSGEYDSTGS